MSEPDTTITSYIDRYPNTPHTEIEELIKSLLLINERYAALESRIYNAIYLGKIGMLPDDQVKIDTACGICGMSISRTLEAFDIQRIPKVAHTNLTRLYKRINKRYTKVLATR
jgi:hypothetical protein